MSGTFGPQWNSGKAWRACKRDDCSDSERASEARTVSTSNANVAPVRAYKAMLRPCYYSGLNLNDAARCSSFFFPLFHLEAQAIARELRRASTAERRRINKPDEPSGPATTHSTLSRIWISSAISQPAVPRAAPRRN